MSVRIQCDADGCQSTAVVEQAGDMPKEWFSFKLDVALGKNPHLADKRTIGHACRLECLWSAIDEGSSALIASYKPKEVTGT